jgi:15-cis-phytoene synthase
VDQSLTDDLKSRDRERWLSILWAPADARAALLALHAYDLEQQRVVAEAREPMLAEIRLAWWREQLEHLSAGKLAPPQPILRALRHQARTHGADLTDLARIEEGFLPLLTEGRLDALAMARDRGGPLFRALFTVITGRPLSTPEAEAATASGTRWALAKLWRGGWGQAEVRLTSLDPPAFPLPPAAPLPPSLRALDTLAAQDWSRLEKGRQLAPPAGPGRQLRMAFAALRRS